MPEIGALETGVLETGACRDRHGRHRPGLGGLAPRADRRVAAVPPPTVR